MTHRVVVLEGGVPWGFRMQGGVDVKTPLRVSRVNPGSKAAQRGIREGDLITTINGESTKTLTSNEIHDLLKSSGSTLKLELNEGAEPYSTKKRYRTVHQETHQETVKRSSVTYVKETVENDYNQFGNDLKPNEISVVTNIPVSQKSSSSSSTSTSGTLLADGKTPSTDRAVASRQSSYSNCSSIPDEGLLSEWEDMNDDTGPLSKSKKRRQRRKNLLARHQQPIEIALQPTTTNLEVVRLNRIEHKYKVESPKELNKKRLKTKSKSLDGDDFVKIQELSEASESEEVKNPVNVVISEASSDENFLESDSEVKITPEEEHVLRSFLDGLKLVSSPEESARELQLQTNPKTKKQQLAEYFSPIVENPRYLDAISEEASDLSDREQAGEVCKVISPSADHAEVVYLEDSSLEVSPRDFKNKPFFDYTKSPNILTAKEPEKLSNEDVKKGTFQNLPSQETDTHDYENIKWLRDSSLDAPEVAKLGNQNISREKTAKTINSDHSTAATSPKATDNPPEVASLDMKNVASNEDTSFCQFSSDKMYNSTEKCEVIENDSKSIQSLNTDVSRSKIVKNTIPAVQSSQLDDKSKSNGIGNLKIEDATEQTVKEINKNQDGGKALFQASKTDFFTSKLVEKTIPIHLEDKPKSNGNENLKIEAPTEETVKEINKNQDGVKAFENLFLSPKTDLSSSKLVENTSETLQSDQLDDKSKSDNAENLKIEAPTEEIVKEINKNQDGGKALFQASKTDFFTSKLVEKTIPIHLEDKSKSNGNENLKIEAVTEKIVGKNEVRVKGIDTLFQTPKTATSSSNFVENISKNVQTGQLDNKPKSNGTENLKIETATKKNVKEINKNQDGGKALFQSYKTDFSTSKIVEKTIPSHLEDKPKSNGNKNLKIEAPTEETVKEVNKNQDGQNTLFQSSNTDFSSSKVMENTLKIVQSGQLDNKLKSNSTENLKIEASTEKTVDTNQAGVKAFETLFQSSKTDFSSSKVVEKTIPIQLENRPESTSAENLKIEAPTEKNPNKTEVKGKAFDTFFQASKTANSSTKLVENTSKIGQLDTKPKTISSGNLEIEAPTEKTFNKSQDEVKAFESLFQSSKTDSFSSKVRENTIPIQLNTKPKSNGSGNLKIEAPTEKIVSKNEVRVKAVDSLFQTSKTDFFSSKAVDNTSKIVETGELDNKLKSNGIGNLKIEAPTEKTPKQNQDGVKAFETVFQSSKTDFSSSKLVEKTTSSQLENKPKSNGTGNLKIEAPTVNKKQDEVKTFESLSQSSKTDFSTTKMMENTTLSQLDNNLNSNSTDNLKIEAPTEKTANKNEVRVKAVDSLFQSSKTDFSSSKLVEKTTSTQLEDKPKSNGTGNLKIEAPTVNKKQDGVKTLESLSQSSKTDFSTTKMMENTTLNQLDNNLNSNSTDNLKIEVPTEKTANKNEVRVKAVDSLFQSSKTDFSTTKMMENTTLSQLDNNLNSNSTDNLKIEAPTEKTANKNEVRVKAVDSLFQSSKTDFSSSKLVEKTTSTQLEDKPKSNGTGNLKIEAPTVNKKQDGVKTLESLSQSSKTYFSTTKIMENTTLSQLDNNLNSNSTDNLKIEAPTEKTANKNEVRVKAVDSLFQSSKTDFSTTKTMENTNGSDNLKIEVPTVSNFCRTTSGLHMSKSTINGQVDKEEFRQFNLKENTVNGNTEVIKDFEEYVTPPKPEESKLRHVIMTSRVSNKTDSQKLLDFENICKLNSEIQEKIEKRQLFRRSKTPRVKEEEVSSVCQSEVKEVEKSLVTSRVKQLEPEEGSVLKRFLNLEQPPVPPRPQPPIPPPRRSKAKLPQPPTTISNVVTPPRAPSPDSSESEESSSRCTAKYNPNSSLADVSSLADECTFQPKSLRDLVLQMLVNFPFGELVLKELAEVSKRLADRVIRFKGPNQCEIMEETKSPNRLLAIIREEQAESEPVCEERLRAKNLGEWLTLARHKSMSTSNLDWPKNSFLRPDKFANSHRRLSLPQEIYEKQLIDIMEKEREIQRELEQLEEEKRKLQAELAPSKHFQVDDFYVSKKGDFAERRERPLSMPAFPTEFFRQQMYQEYMDKFIEREERKQQKVIKISSVGDHPKEIIHPVELEQEFMEKVKQKKLGQDRDEREEATTPGSSDTPVIVLDRDKVTGIEALPPHLREFVDDLATQEDSSVWSPGQLRRPPTPPNKHYQRTDSQGSQNDPISPVWTPKSANSSPVAERKEFRPVNFQSPVLGRRTRTKSETILDSEPPWKLPEGSSDPALNLSFTLDRRLPSSQSSPGLGGVSRLPRVQNPTVTLLQKAREGQLPRGAQYLDQDRKPPNDRPPIKYPGEVLYQIKNEYTSDPEGEKPKKMADLAPRKFEGIGPTTKDGMPLILRSEVKNEDQSRWYKRMYDTIHKQKPHKDEYVTIKYRQKRAQYPYTSGYLSEPEPGAYDSDFSEYKYQTLDRRRTPQQYLYFNETAATMPRTVPDKSYSSSDIVKNSQEKYYNQPGRIENYRPGHSSISEKEARRWWDEVMDIFDGHLEQQKRVPPLKPRSFINQALKESGYESDSTLVFKRKEETAAGQLSPKEQKEVYKAIQKGGDVPFKGLRKPAPERPKEPDLPPPPPPPKSQGGVRSQEQESPRKYVENEVTIHYKTPIRTEIKDYVSEEELAQRQAEAMKRIYEEEKRRKYLQVDEVTSRELQDMKSRRHTDNFTPSQKSPIPLNRYDDFDSLSSPPKPRTRSPEPRLVARALYNFVGQSAKELTFRKGELIYVRRQIDKNWYEGELNAMVGLFPVNYVEIVPYEGNKVTTPRKAHEGQARAKYNFIAQTHLELSLAKGELVTVTRRVDDNWYEGKIGGRKGIFPVSYVEILIDPSEPPPPSSKPVASPAAHSLLLNGSSQGKESMGSHLYTPNIPNPIMQRDKDNGFHHAKPVQLSGVGTYSTLPKPNKSPIDQTLHIETQSEPVPYRALYKYTPQNDDELELLEGDTVYVLEKCDDGWYVGSSDRTGAFGTFPGNYVERI